MRRRVHWLLVMAMAIALLGGLVRSLRAQGPQPTDRLATMAPYQQYVKRLPLYQNAITSGALNVTWAPAGASFTYAFAGRSYRFDVAERKAVDTGEAPAEGGGAGRGGGRGAAGGGGGGGGRGRGGADVPE